MGKPIGAERPSPWVKIQPDPILFPAQSRQQIEEPAIPLDYQLTVSTSKGVYTWDSDGVTEIFRSGSKGIVAVRKAANDLLAVADSHVVILHDTKQATHKSYRLKGAGGQTGLLQYSHDSMTLFFTSNLQHSVQSYSLKYAELSDASSTHPSPPDVFALSHTSHLLLSASISPPTIHLSSIVLKTPPILLQPQCSSSAVVTAGFHPERANLFFLAFADGSLALYDASRFFEDEARGPRKSGPASSGVGAELGYIRKVHALGAYGPTSGSEVSLQTHCGYDPSTDTVHMGSKVTGITGAAFVPDHLATIMTIGADGKCCVISFQPLANRSMSLNGSGNVTILRSWHLHGPATCLSITSFSGRGVPSLSGDTSSRHEHFQDPPTTIAAVGCYDGHVLLYRLDGTLIEWRSFDADRDPVIGVEWMHMKNASTQSRRTRPQPNSRPKRKRLGSVFTAGRRTKSEVIAVMDVQEEAASVPIPPTPKHVQPYDKTKLKPRKSTSAVYHMDLESQTKSSSSTAFSEDTVYQTATEDPSNSRSSDGMTRPTEELDEAKATGYNDGPNEQSSSDTIIKTASYPEIPPRPTISRPGGLLSRRRAETSQSLMSKERSKQLSAETLSEPNMKNSATTEPPGNLQKPDTSNAFVSTPEAISSEWIELNPYPLELNAASSANNKTGSRNSMLLPLTRESEASHDTVIDWAHGAGSQAVPTMTLSPAPAEQHQLTPPPLKRSFAHKPRKPAPASIKFDQSAKSDDTVVHWGPGLKKSPRLFDIHKDLIDPSAVAGPSAAEQTPPPPVIAATGSPSRKAPPTPLTETAHNRSHPILAPSPSKSVASPPSGPPPPPPLPPRPAPRELPPLPPEGQSAALLQGTLEALRRTLHKDFKSLHRDMHAEFEKQKTWFENLMRERDGWMRRVEEENGRLREELNRVTARGKRR